MTTKYGMFAENKYMPGGGPEASPPGSAGQMTAKVVFDATGGGNREKGLNMKATVPKTGKNNDATFDKFKSLSTGDKYVDSKKADLQYTLKKKEGNVSDLPFRPAAPSKKSVCPGDYYGTSGKIPYMPQGGNEARKKGDFPEGLKGIYTSPAKKGTFGMNKFTLSERQGYKGVASEYEYHADPDDHHKARRLLAIENHHKACVTDHPFKPSSTNASKRVTPVPYMPCPDSPRRKKGEGEEGAEGGVPPTEVVPFRPANAHVAKRINAIPYIHDPEDPKLQKEKDKRLEESKRLAVTGAWRPNMGGGKTDMVRSVVRMNIPRFG